MSRNINPEFSVETMLLTVCVCIFDLICNEVVYKKKVVSDSEMRFINEARVNSAQMIGARMINSLCDLSRCDFKVKLYATRRIVRHLRCSRAARYFI